MSVAEATRVRSAGEEGYFPEGRSILRRVHSERAVGLFYGQRALMIGALNPLAFVGTIEHTNARQMPFQRLARTAETFETIFFGSRAEADRALASVQRLHQRVSGVMPADAGVTRAGTPYSAFDPELMLWTLAVIADSGPFFYELFVAPLGDYERDRLWREYVRFGELFGMPREVAPATHREFRAWWEEKLASDEMYLTPEAREIGYATAFEIPLPRIRDPAKRVHDLIMLGSIPPGVRELYGLEWSAAKATAFRATVAALRGARPLTPGGIKRGWNTGSFRLVARTERRRLQRGQRTPQVA
jgi:uncharacterized protein (DUF2236 family)